MFLAAKKNRTEDKGEIGNGENKDIGKDEIIRNGEIGKIRTK